MNPRQPIIDESSQWGNGRNPAHNLVRLWQEQAQNVDNLRRAINLIVAHSANLFARDESDPDGPIRTWSVTLANLGDDRYRLKTPLVVMLEDFGSEIVASWPEVESWGSGPTEASAINALKDDLIRLCEDLLAGPTDALGKLPKRWAMALASIIETRGV